MLVQGGKCRNFRLLPFKVYAIGRGRLLGKPDAGSALGRRPDRTRAEAAAAVGADVVQVRIHAIRAERALEAADARVGGSRRQILVAVFAVRPEFQHVRAFGRGERPLTIPPMRSTRTLKSSGPDAGLDVPQLRSVVCDVLCRPAVPVNMSACPPVRRKLRRVEVDAIRPQASVHTGSAVWVDNLLPLARLSRGREWHRSDRKWLGTTPDLPLGDRSRPLCTLIKCERGWRLRQFEPGAFVIGRHWSSFFFATMITDQDAPRRQPETEITTLSAV